MAGRKPTVDFYDNLTYFIPGTLAFKGFKTVAVGTAAGVAKTKLEMSGLGDVAGAGMLQPVSVQDQTIGNPWMNYSIYLSPSFCFGAIALMIFLMTTFSITMEIKNGTSTEWLSTARGSIGVALLGKLIPSGWYGALWGSSYCRYSTAICIFRAHIWALYAWLWSCLSLQAWPWESYLLRLYLIRVLP